MQLNKVKQFVWQGWVKETLDKHTRVRQCPYGQYHQTYNSVVCVVQNEQASEYYCRDVHTCNTRVVREGPVPCPAADTRLGTQNLCEEDTLQQCTPMCLFDIVTSRSKTETACSRCSTRPLLSLERGDRRVVGPLGPNNASRHICHQFTSN